MARIEAGLLLPDSEFVNAEFTLRVNRGRTPFELGMDWLVDTDKGQFNGRRALLKQKQEGLKRCLVGLEVDGKKPAHDALIYDREHGSKEVGATTCSLWSPTLKNNIAMAMIATEREPESERRADMAADHKARSANWDKLVQSCYTSRRPMAEARSSANSSCSATISRPLC
jgi:aminomethyltransferase